jgi:hypothetical protein
MKPVMLFAAALLLALSSTAQAYTTCDLPNPSCSGLAATCVAYNKKAGSPTDRCAGYKAQCMQTGAWQDRNCSRSVVERR